VQSVTRPYEGSEDFFLPVVLGTVDDPGLFRKIQRHLDGSLPLFTSDGLRHYPEVLLELFGHWETPSPKGLRGRLPKPRRVPSPALGYAQVQKERQGGQVIQVTRSVIFGKHRLVEAQAAPLKRADGKTGQNNTAYIERDNLTLRKEFHRLARKTLGFSKNGRELQNALDFIDAHDNFVKPRRALRLRASEKRKRIWTPQAPDMAAGISNHVWALDELLYYKA